MGWDDGGKDGSQQMGQNNSNIHIGWRGELANYVGGYVPLKMDAGFHLF